MLGHVYQIKFIKNLFLARNSLQFFSQPLLASLANSKMYHWLWHSFMTCWLYSAPGLQVCKHFGHISNLWTSLTCRLTWCLWMKLFSHTGQTNSRPRWAFMWNLKPPLVMNPFPHSWHENGMRLGWQAAMWRAILPSGIICEQIWQLGGSDEWKRLGDVGGWLVWKKLTLVFSL